MAKPRLWLEWEERMVRMDCRLANFVTFAEFKEAYSQNDRKPTQKRKREMDDLKQLADSPLAAKRSRREPQFYGSG
ncbi:hypothetical protein L486_06996 [Kwoniella mangroviensis CBS 10435]|uniref:Uncharacterized protein n=1 Tax=Kwoniella mangroviensis CBS 10435 TaxID=1331196 RepID=A0A1B9IJ03_9TREE|nr:uncharacterized protein I203_07758 [Kwoniella mangroviensis CBS 8507]OCF55512.1 hypothetical protein L486_06996 [Kwoniella mangroviensis CBS 10435]OCF63333.1 hypothetical protein I203_07758 [Kwoniella mangroviensis CBS 8507]OCF73759.1 hypothetical protein I204_05603 [Kwoniella mangroviensis CBS 8886]